MDQVICRYHANQAATCGLYNAALTSMQSHEFIQRRINVDATSWRLYKVPLRSMQLYDV